MTERHGHAPVVSFTMLAGGEMAARVVAFVGTVYLTRRLGPSAFGIVELATAISAYGLFLVTAGFDAIGVREVARQPGRVSEIAAGGTVVRLCLAAAGVVAIGVLGLALEKPAIVRIVVGLTALTLVSTAADLSWVHKGLQRGRAVGTAFVVGQCVYVVGLLWWVDGAADVWIVPLALVAGQFVTAWLLARRFWPLRPSAASAREGARILVASLPITLSRLCRAVMLGAGVLLLALFADERSVGLFGSAFRFAFFVMAIGVALHVSYLPVLTRAVAESADATAAVTSRVFALSAALAWPLVIGGSVVAGPLVTTSFGAAYAEAAAPFRLLLAGIGLGFLHGAFRNVLIASNRTVVDTVIMATAAVVTVTASVIWIPRSGMSGAAASILIGEAVVLVLVWLAVGRRGVRVAVRSMWRPLVAALVMGAVLLMLVSSWPVAATMAAGAVLYYGVLAALGGVPPDVRAWLTRTESGSAGRE